MPIRCHYIPKYFLENFVEPSNKALYVYNKYTYEISCQLPKDTAVIGDYYITRADKEGKKNKVLEEIFSVLEGAAKPIINNIINRPTCHLTDSEHDILCTFISFLHVRVPWSVELMRESYSKGLDLLWDMIKKDAEDPVKLQESYQDYINRTNDLSISLDEYKNIILTPKDSFEIVIDEKYALAKSLSFAKELYKILLSMNMQVAIHKGNNFFILSDSPVCIFAMANRVQAILGAGFGLPNAQISLPLNQKTCLYFTNKKSENEIITASHDFVEEMNKRSIFCSEKYIISTYKSNRLIKAIKKYSSQYLSKKIDPDEFKGAFYDRFNKQ